jgi:hypothetical protein
MTDVCQFSDYDRRKTNATKPREKRRDAAREIVTLKMFKIREMAA